jgi:hypothetical protein
MQVHPRPSPKPRRLKAPARGQKGNEREIKTEIEKEEDKVQSKVDPQQEEKDDAPALKPAYGFSFFAVSSLFLFPHSFFP